jgi:hypothetical protein
MAAHCPCGCGRKLGFTERGIAKKVRAFDERLNFQREYAANVRSQATEAQAERMQQFIAAGEGIRESLIDVLHGADARITDRGELNAWHKIALRIETDVIVGAYRAHKQGGLTSPPNADGPE